MSQRYYHTNEFAKKTSVTVRTLQYYDKEGVLSPTEYTQAGYRIYSDNDLIKMQQILALKYLGFSLSQIKFLIQTGPQQFPAALQTQKAMLLEKRAQLDSIIHAIEETEKVVDGGAVDYNAIAKIMEVIQLELKPGWINKYLTSDERNVMRNLAVQSPGSSGFGTVPEGSKRAPISGRPRNHGRNETGLGQLQGAARR